MEAILPYNAKDKTTFYNSALEVGFDSFTALKWNFIMDDSDLDVFQLMGDERLSLLVYGWQVCHKYLESRHANAIGASHGLPIGEDAKLVMKRLAQCSLDIWFSREWGVCSESSKVALLVCLDRAKPTLMEFRELSAVNWDYLLRLDMAPWNLEYIRTLVRDCEEMSPIIEDSVWKVDDLYIDDDTDFFKQEGIFVVLLRLVKLFDASNMEQVKELSMRLIIACTKYYDEITGRTDDTDPQTIDELKRCVVLVCHIHLMAIYETDDKSGLTIDNMMHNLRFYCESLHDIMANEQNPSKCMEYSAACYIAMICQHLNMRSIDFFNAFIFYSFDEYSTSLFGVIAQAYKSYLLGNYLMVLNNKDPVDFSKNLEHYKRIFDLYVLERERSELFLQRELQKQEWQRNSHNKNIVIKNLTDFKDKIGKGNRVINTSSNEYSSTETRVDPIFQNIPNNANALNYVYGVLSKRNFEGWHFAKILLLIKIICHEYNAIETWRYHPGLTTEFMMSLEIKLSRHFEDLATIFKEHPFMEQEFWLTAFYLDPNPRYYKAIIRCGVRYNRRRPNTDANEENTKPGQTESINQEKVGANELSAKFGLLSSTVDVGAIIALTNDETPKTDYESLQNELRSLHLPENTMKDLITITFQSRNKKFTWAVGWLELRTRCKDLLSTTTRKRRFVELNMAEANDRLKFLKIDYDKYKHRPQLDYGTIELGYENAMNFGSYANTLEDDEDDDNDDDDDDDDDFDDFENERAHDRKTSKADDEHEELSQEFFSNTVRTRARTAAVIATVGFKEQYEKNKRKAEEDVHHMAVQGSPHDSDDNTQGNSNLTSASNDSIDVEKVYLTEWLKERPTYHNDTVGFKPFADIWNFSAGDLPTGKQNTVLVMDTDDLLSKYWQLETSEGGNIQLASNDTPAYIGQTSTENKQIIGKQHAANKEYSSLATRVVHKELETGLPTNAKATTRMNAGVQKNVSNMQSKTATAKAETAAPATDVKVSGAAPDSGVKDLNDDDSHNHNSAKQMEKAELLKLCTVKQLQIKLRRLTASDVTQLRQPLVRLKRMNMQQYFENVNSQRRVQQVLEKADNEFDDSVHKSSSSDSDYLRKLSKRSNMKRAITLRTQKRKQYTSEYSSNDSDDYDNWRQHSLRAARDLSSTTNQTMTSRAKKLMVTPLSESGLKLRISSSENIAIMPGSTSCANSVDYLQISPGANNPTGSNTSSSTVSSPTVSEETELDMYTVYTPIVQTHTELTELTELTDMTAADPLYMEDMSDS